MNQDYSPDDEIVNFPVPKRYLSVVIRALADAMREKDISLPSSSTHPGQTGQGEWTKDEIIRLKHEIRNQTVLLLLNLTCERAGEWVDLSEICKKAGRTQRQAQGDLAGFTQLVKRRFGKNGQNNWPVEVKWGLSPEEPTRYSMQHPDIARWWREA